MKSKVIQDKYGNDVHAGDLIAIPWGPNNVRILPFDGSLTAGGWPRVRIHVTSEWDPKDRVYKDVDKWDRIWIKTENLILVKRKDGSVDNIKLGI